MCGIAGYVGLHRPELLGPMCRAIAHRGPDDSGIWYDAEAGVGLGHRRLSIIDLSPAGRQPMSNGDATTWITYNGEIYNFSELREDLVRRGHRFRSRSDTEVIVHLYDELGIGCLDELNGIFAFAIWDARRGELVLARDHAGIKPLYYHVDGERLYFASEIKSLLRVPGIEREIHLPSLGDYLTFQWVPGEHTLLSSIKKIEPGHYLVWRDGAIETRRWFTLAWEPDATRSEEEWVEEVHETFLRTTRRQMVSDVPLGAFLSGGLDSSSIVACMRGAFPTRQISAYTVRFRPGEIAEEQGVDDFPYAEKVAKSLGVDLKSIPLDPRIVFSLPKMIYHLDEPDADPAVFPCYVISRLAREDGTTVLLSGTGGDEVFFGYRSHQAERWYARYPWVSRPSVAAAIAVAGALAGLLLGAHHRHARRLAKFRRGSSTSGLQRFLAVRDWSTPEIRRALYSQALRREIDPFAVSECMRTYYRSFVGSGELNRHSHMLIQSFLAAHNFLYTDKASMAVGLEARVPFMDVELMRLCARIPEELKLREGVTKYLLKKAMESHLPKDVIYRGKTGFGVPLRRWIQRDLRDVIGDVLGPGRVAARGLFDPDYVRRIVAQNESGKVDHGYLIYALINLELWMQTFLDRPGVEIRL